MLSVGTERNYTKSMKYKELTKKISVSDHMDQRRMESRLWDFPCVCRYLTEVLLAHHIGRILSRARYQPCHGERLQRDQ